MLTIHGRTPSKKNSKQRVINSRGVFMIPSKKHKEWHEAAMWELMSQRPKKGISRCKVSMMFYMPDNRVTDLTNKAESVMDLLVDAGVILDDNWKVVRPVILDCAGVVKEDPRVEINIEELSTGELT